MCLDCFAATSMKLDSRESFFRNSSESRRMSSFRLCQMHQKGSKMVMGTVRLGWLICGFVALCEPALSANTSPTCFQETCQKTRYDSREAVCCQNQLHSGAGLSCCGDKAFNRSSASCCSTTDGHFEVTEGVSAEVSSCCGLKAYDELNEICCGSTVLARPAAKAECCGEGAYDVERELCCGGEIQVKNSTDHLCCRHGQYNFRTECCTINDDETEAEITPKLPGSPCPGETSGVLLDQKREPLPLCNRAPKTHLCGSKCYNPNRQCCCKRNDTKCHSNPASGHCDGAFAVYPKTHDCCDSHVKPGMDQGTGETRPGVVWYNNALYKDREDGEEWSDTNIPYNPAKGTVCCRQFHGSPGQHCCGTEVYQPDNEICCDGHRYPKKGNPHCCGIKAYNMTDPNMKCCAGTLHHVPHPKSSDDVECCGSTLLNPQGQEVCCSSKDKAVLYSRKTGFSCCGHRYFNLSLWTCGTEGLSPVEPGQQQRKMTGCKLQSVNNLKETHLCSEIYIGVVQSVSPNSIVFRSVLKINGAKRDVHPVPFHYVLATPNHCNAPKLVLGTFYFFSDTDVFADVNHDTALQSLYFILSKCSP